MSDQSRFVQNVRYRAAEFLAVGRPELAAVMGRWVEDAQLADMMGVESDVCTCDRCQARIGVDTAVCPVCGADLVPF